MWWAWILCKEYFLYIIWYLWKSLWNPCMWCLGSWTHIIGSLLMMTYGPLCDYMAIGMLTEVDPMDMPWYVEEYYEEVLGTLVVGGVVFDTLKCGAFDVLKRLKNLRVLYHVFANNPIIGRYSLPSPFHLYVECLLTPYNWRVFIF